MSKKPLSKKQRQAIAAQKLKSAKSRKKSWQHLFLLGITALACSCGAISALLLAATPFKNSGLRLPELAGFSTLNRPLNVLVLGIDNSGHPHQNNFTPTEAFAGNSDTMLLVRFIPSTHQINILSIPRDTLVEMQGVGIDKVNDANVLGGAKLAIQTVSHLLGDLPIDRYVRLDTEGFVQLVDALGGVEVNIPKEMHYVDKTQNLQINFLPGKQQLNGKHLQEYIRFRHDELGDIGRVQRQQEALKAILQVVLSPSTIGNLPEILEVARQNIDSDLSVQEMLGIAQFLTHTNRQKMNQVMLPGRFSRPAEYPASYWLTNPEATNLILSNYFDLKTNFVNALADSTDNLKYLNIAVANATGKAGQAAKVVDFFRKQGFNNAYITDHEIDSETIPASETQIIAQQGNPNAANAIHNILGVGQVQVEATGDIVSDLTVVVGTDLTNILPN